MKKLSNKKILLGSITVMVITLIIGFTTALWTRNFTQTGQNRITSDCFDIQYEETSGDITLANIYPQTDEDGLKNKPYQVTIKNTCATPASYNVILHRVNTSTLADQYIKVGVNGSYKLLSNYSTTSSSLSGITNARIISQGALGGNTERTLNIVSWMEENTSEANGENKSFNYRVTIEASATSSRLSNVILLSNPVNTAAPTTSALYYGEPSAQKSVSGKTYKKYEDAWTGSISSSSNMAVGSSYTFNSSTGYFTLSGTTATSVSYGSSYVGYYACSANLIASSTANQTSNCSSLLKIEEVSGTTLTKATRITSAFSTSGSGLFSAQDDDGTSYYYRGEVDNNYVSFAGKTWRIVRVNGDGTIRLILEDSTYPASAFNSTYAGHKYVGYTYDNKNNAGTDTKCTKANPCISEYDYSANTFTMKQNNVAMNTSSATINSTIKGYLENTYYKNNLRSYDSYIAYSTYCNDTSTNDASASQINYGAYNRGVRNNSSTPSPVLTCNITESNIAGNYGGVYKLKIGLLSADEMNLAGYTTTSTYYSTNRNYLYYNGYWWSGSPYNSNTSNAYVMYGRCGYLDHYTVSIASYAVRPVINLNTDVLVSTGDGTKTNPYVIST